MTISLLLFIFLLLVIFAISRLLIKNLYLILLRLTHSRFWTIQLLTWVFLPGTFLHELSHTLTAEMLGVHTANFSVIPRIEDEQVRLGSVSIAKSGPFRRTIIGIAPLIIGITILSILTIPLNQSKFFSPINSLILFFFFVITNTMFASKKDLEAAAVPTIILFLLLSSLWLGNITFNLPETWINTSQKILDKLNLALATTLFINLGILVIITAIPWLLTKAWRWLRH